MCYGLRLQRRLEGQENQNLTSRHRHHEYLGFLLEIENNVPKTLDVNIIVDNSQTSASQTPVRSTAAILRAIHSHVCFVAEPSGDLVQSHHQQAIRRGTFRSVKELVEKIDHYVQSSNAHAQPFVWTATADSILAKVQRLCERISGTEH
jgi:putative transposase